MAVAIASGCGLGVLDNYDEPTSTLTGRVVHEGVALGVRSNEVQLELWQPGYALNQKIPVYIDQDGTFSATLFDGTYKINVLPGSGPFVDIRDTITIDLRGQATVDVPVTPYYTIRNAQIRNNNGTIEATFNVGSINTTRTLQFVAVYVSTTNIVDRQNFIVRTERLRSTIPNLTDPITVTVPLTAALASRDYIFARLGIMTTGVTPLLFGPVVKIDL
jgi:hypothetical protein